MLRHSCEWCRRHSSSSVVYTDAQLGWIISEAAAAWKYAYIYLSPLCKYYLFIYMKKIHSTYRENRHALSKKVSPHWFTAYSSNGTALWIIISSEYSILVRTSICTYTSESGELNLIVATKHRTTESSIEEGAQTISPFNKHTHT